jgi:sugar phosphate isomerase/epimerase
MDGRGVRLAVASGPLPGDVDDVDEHVVRAVAELGFTGVHVHFGETTGESPADLTSERCRRAGARFAEHGVEIFCGWGWNARLVAWDETERSEQVALLAESLRVASDLGAEMIVTGSGSHNLRGGYWPHRDNHARGSKKQLIRSLAEVAPRAEELGVAIALESHCATTLRSPEETREVIDTVNSPAVRANLDPKNFIADLASLWHFDVILDRTFDALAEVAVSGHVNDAYAEDRLVVHISETVLGHGDLNIADYLTRFEASLSDSYMVLEHLPAALVPQAKLNLDRLLAEAGVTPW